MEVEAFFATWANGKNLLRGRNGGVYYCLRMERTRDVEAFVEAVKAFQRFEPKVCEQEQKGSRREVQSRWEFAIFFEVERSEL